MRLFGITIPDNKQLQYGLTEIFGVGLSRSQKVLASLSIDPTAKPESLTPDQEIEIRKALEAFTLEGDLKREVQQNIKRLKDINSYRGTRHMKRLPLNGQRTKTNSRTVRGNKRNTMASGRIKVSKT